MKKNEAKITRDNVIDTFNKAREALERAEKYQDFVVIPMFAQREEYKKELDEYVKQCELLNVKVIYQKYL